MRPTTLLFSLLAVASSVVYAQPTAGSSGIQAHNARHHQHRSHAHAVSRSESNKLKKRSGSSKKKRCKAVSTSSGAQAEQTSSSSSSTHHATATTTSSSSHASATTGSSSSNSSSNATGILKVQDAKCGPNGAVSKTTETAGPNGGIDFMNCGIAKGKSTGWTPPQVTMDDVIVMSLSDALKDSSSPFKACSKYLSTFQNVANKYNIPDIILASFALQESSCNPNEKGGGGEVGMFQLSQDKCPGGKASSACYDVDTNTDLAGKYIQSQLNDLDNNAFKLVGYYNGWSDDMTYADATKAADSDCCRCQNNLDYLQQFWNGWTQNIDAYDTKLGKYFNLDSCPNDGANGRKRGVPRTLRERNPVKGGWRF